MGHRSGSNTRVFTVVVSVVVALTAVPMVALLAVSGAPSTLGIAAVLAAVPVVPLVAAYLWLDRYEPEPPSLLALAMAWGAIVACFAAIMIGSANGPWAQWGEDLRIVAAAPLIEEAAKGAFLVGLLWWRRDELDGILDGIVYAGMVGIGFAFTENILYLMAAYDGSDMATPGGAEALTQTFVVRCLASPFAHPLFTACVGIGVGLAVGQRRRITQVALASGGYVAAVALHGAWNAASVHGGSANMMMSAVLLVPVFAALVGLALWARGSEAGVLEVALADCAKRGLIPAADVAWITDLRARSQARAFARQHGGSAGLSAMREYQQAAIELGFLHYRFLRGTPPPDFTARGQEYLDRIGRVRPTIAFPGQVVLTP